MFNAIKSLFRAGANNEVIEALANNALIVDVRSEAEHKSGTIKGAINIPLDKLNSELHRLPTHKPFVVFCRSGFRSGEATKLLQAKGYNKVVNGGGLAQMKAILAK